MKSKRVPGMSTVNLPYLRTKAVVVDRSVTDLRGSYTETGRCTVDGVCYSVRRFSRTGQWTWTSVVSGR